MKMTTVKVKFRPSTVEGRPGAIVYSVTRRRVVRQITTEYRLFAYEWDEVHAKPVPFLESSKRTAVVRQIARKVDLDVEKLNGIVERFDRLHLNYSSEDVIAEFRREKEDNTLFGFMENVITRLRQLKHIGTADNYRAALDSFRRFRNDRDIEMDAINHIVMEDYQAYLLASGLVPNSVSFYMRILRAVYNRAVGQDLINDCKPFRSVFTGMEKTLKRAISVSDIKLIKNLDLTSRPSLEFARDIFMFLFFCRGMSFIDAAFLKKTDVQNGVLTYRRHKTNQVLRIKIIKPIKELIDRYSSDGIPYLLPIITRSGNDERKQYATALRRVNNALKTIAGMTGLRISLTTYVSRHSWATIAKSKHVPVSIIADALGHESISTTQIYLASIDTAAIDRVNDMIVKDL